MVRSSDVVGTHPRVMRCGSDSVELKSRTEAYQSPGDRAGRSSVSTDLPCLARAMNSRCRICHCYPEFECLFYDIEDTEHNIHTSTHFPRIPHTNPQHKITHHHDITHLTTHKLRHPQTHTERRSQWWLFATEANRRALSISGLGDTSSSTLPNGTGVSQQKCCWLPHRSTAIEDDSEPSSPKTMSIQISASAGATIGRTPVKGGGKGSQGKGQQQQQQQFAPNQANQMLMQMMMMNGFGAPAAKAVSSNTCVAGTPQSGPQQSPWTPQQSSNNLVCVDSI